LSLTPRFFTCRGRTLGFGPPAAIANAIEDAIGVRIKDLPLSADKILRALQGETLESPDLDTDLLQQLRG